jgi:cell division protein FtsL
MMHRPFTSRLENGPIRGSGRRTVRGLFPFIFFLASCVAVGSGFIAVRSGKEGIRKEIVTLSKEKDRLVEENRVLHREFATLSSPSRIITLAREQGLVFPEAGSFRTLTLAEAPPETGGPDTGAASASSGSGSPLTALLRGLLHDAVPPPAGHVATP